MPCLEVDGRPAKAAGGSILLDVLYRESLTVKASFFFERILLKHLKTPKEEIRIQEQLNTSTKITLVS